MEVEQAKQELAELAHNDKNGSQQLESKQRLIKSAQENLQRLEAQLLEFQVPGCFQTKIK